MAIELKQSLKLSQQLVMTPQLQQAIKLLQLNRMELAEHCMTELVENPLLEEIVNLSENREEKLEQREKEANKEVDPQKEQGSEDINWENYLNSQSHRTASEGRAIRDYDPDKPSFEANLVKETTMIDHLLQQLNVNKMIDADRRIANAIICNLEEDGYLRTSCEEIAQSLQVDFEDVEAVLEHVQRFDPVGVAARNLKECLLAQCHHRKSSHLVKMVIREHLTDLENKNYTEICKSTGMSKQQLSKCIDYISSLDPRPGRQFYNENSNYITPDIYVDKVNGEYVIRQNEDGLPKLRISKLYEQALRGAKTSESAKEYINEKLRSAIWLIRSIHQRQRTIYKVTESIVKMQRDFFEKGIVGLKPMVLKDVAEDIGMHESTVSRVTTNKYVHTPQGIFELKFFFNSGIKRVEGTNMASEAVKEKIRLVIQSEDTKKPFSDQEIVELLRQKNIDIARRTVAKYREMLGILSSSKRKQVLLN
ncbi:RNA polymerase factor sigma-54 [bacterium]|nr:RNA polymerase factor sigma-54 [bacterium]